MPSVVPGQADLEAQLRRHVERNVMPRLARGLQVESRDAAPRDSGALAESITATWKQRSKNIYRVQLAQDGKQAPYGAALNNPSQTDGRIHARRRRALRFDAGGGTVFRRSVRQSTEHRGWWDEQPLTEWATAAFAGVPGGFLV